MASSRFYIRMGIVGAGAVALLFLLAPSIWPIFQTNAALNGIILGVLLVGIIFSIQQIVILKPELKWLETVSASERPLLAGEYDPKILSPLATMLNKNAHFSASALRAALDSIDARLQESKDIGRYLVGLLVFLGLLGTFWGLSLTIKSVSSVITNLPSGTGVVMNFLEQLKTGLQAPLDGMGVAFSSSLFGLGSSLILGFFELQTSQARHMFFKTVEENLTDRLAITRADNLSSPGEGMPAYIQALLEQTAENLDGLQRTTSRTEQERQILNSNLSALCEKFSHLIDQRETEQNLLIKVAEGLLEFQNQLQVFSSKITENEFGMDRATKDNISSLNEVSHRLLEATAAGHESLTKELRSEIRVLTKTLNNLASGNSPATT